MKINDIVARCTISLILAKKGYDITYSTKVNIIRLLENFFEMNEFYRVYPKELFRGNNWKE